MTKEALTLALEALEASARNWPSDSVIEAITAIKEALSTKCVAQPEHEKERCVGCEACIDTACGRDECPKGWPKAAQPEQEPVGFAVMQKPWVGLTDEEIEHIIVSVPFADEEDYEVVIRAAVAKLKEKNTRNGGCL